jgi:hypothetical protein
VAGNLGVEPPTLSRTEQLVDALAHCLEARQRIDDVRKRYTTFHSPTMGEVPLGDALQEPTRQYLSRLDALRALLGVLGLAAGGAEVATK